MVDIKEVVAEINKLPFGSKTIQCDQIIKRFQKRKDFVSYDFDLLKDHIWGQRAFFFINLNLIKDPKERFDFIDKHKEVFYSWGCTDQIIKFVNDCDIDYMIEHAEKYAESDATYIQRWGYVMFIFHKERNKIDLAKKMLKLFKNSDELTIQMAQGWLLCELAIFNPDLIYEYLKNKPLNYEVAGKAFSKIHDSFRISNEWKNKFKNLRNLYLK